MKILKATAIAGLATLTIPQSPKAAFLAIDDTSPNEVITVSANGFVGLSVNGNLFQQGLNNPATGTFDENLDGINITGSWIVPGTTGVEGSIAVAFLEPGPQGATIVSDLLFFSVQFGQGLGFLTIHFVSDPEGGPGLDLPTDPNLIRWNEADGPFVLSPPLLTVSVNSDAGHVPDSGPGILGLVTLVAFCGLGASRKLRQKAA